MRPKSSRSTGIFPRGGKRTAGVRRPLFPPKPKLTLRTCFLTSFCETKGKGGWLVTVRD